jgi:hypothetical protein
LLLPASIEARSFWPTGLELPHAALEAFENQWPGFFFLPHKGKILKTQGIFCRSSIFSTKKQNEKSKILLTQTM